MQLIKGKNAIKELLERDSNPRPRDSKTTHLTNSPPCTYGNYNMKLSCWACSTFQLHSFETHKHSHYGINTNFDLPFVGIHRGLFVRLSSRETWRPDTLCGIPGWGAKASWNAGMVLDINALGGVQAQPAIPIHTLYTSSNWIHTKWVSKK